MLVHWSRKVIYSERRHASFSPELQSRECIQTLPSSQDHPVWCLGLPKYNITAKGSTEKVQKKKNIKFRWWNSWPAADFSNTKAPIVVSNPPIIQKSKIPSLAGYGSSSFSNICLNKLSTPLLKSPIIKSLTFHTGKTKISISMLIPLVPIIWNSSRMYNISQIIWCVTKHSVHYLSNIDSNQWGAG